MTINGIPNINLNPLGGVTKKPSPLEADNVFSTLLDNVKNDQAAAEKVTNDFIEGKGVEIHEVMIAGEKAKTSLQLLLEIRNKTIDMYKELTRIQI
ncbi:MAG: flagellar hook-basal body complex protein FliE [Ignavibacteriales bacterium CG_4_9_14_3_um_filter_34_10]|nr:MAG: flagellar hook-basal body complex protein FliE [Ignavibacteriales bacterium CG_4_9_14_3_um_filter_34_10]